MYLQGLEGVNDAIEALHGGDCLRAVVHIAKNEMPLATTPQLKSDIRLEGGAIKQFTHWSHTCQCEMTFSVFLPQRANRDSPNPPVLYYLSGKCRVYLLWSAYEKTL